MARDFFKWDQDFNTGNALIDTQHFSLVEMINDLLELSVNNKTININMVEKISEKLSNYVKEHFSTEEELMEKYSIDPRHMEEHKRLHKEFISEISKHFSDSSKLQNPKRVNEIVEYLIRWLAYHILNTDKSLVRQINYIVNDGMPAKEAFEIEEQMTEQSAEPLLKALKVLYLLVSRKNKEIEKKNAELEEKVKQRTAELLEANEKLSEMLFQDTLTGLPNRRFVMEEIQKLMFSWERYKTPFAILFIDLDKFKAVNDNFGHENGDRVLKWVADFMRNNIRKTDIACRLGGDEFVVICSHTDLESAIKIGQKFNKKCNQEDLEKLEFWNPSLSIGVAMIDERTKTPSDLLKIADSAMYISKSKGGGTTSKAEI